MKLTLKNFANVENAEINLNGVTVLTGKADTGKEYITKTYSYEESEQRLEKDSKTEDIAHAIHVRDAFYSLEEEERYMVALQVFGGYKSREIAELLHKNHNTVRSQVSRALKKMKEKEPDTKFILPNGREAVLNNEKK